MSEEIEKWNDVHGAFSDKEEQRVIFAALDSLRSVLCSIESCVVQMVRLQTNVPKKKLFSHICIVVLNNSDMGLLFFSFMQVKSTKRHSNTRTLEQPISQNSSLQCYPQKATKLLRFTFITMADVGRSAVQFPRYVRECGRRHRHER